MAVKGRPYRPAKRYRKPRVKGQAFTPYRTARRPAPRSVPARRALGAPPTAPPQPAPPRPPTTIPRTPQGIQRRAEADEALRRAQNETNQGLYQSAFAYGDPALIKQYAAKGFGPDVPNESGALQSIGRSETQGVEKLGLGMNAQNTFFSGLHTRDIGKIRDESQRQRMDALNKWKEAEQRLTQALLDAQRARNLEYTGASADEIAEFLSQQPEPTGDLEAIPAEASSPARPKGVKTKLSKKKGPIRKVKRKPLTKAQKRKAKRARKV